MSYIRCGNYFVLPPTNVFFPNNKNFEVHFMNNTFAWTIKEESELQNIILLQIARKLPVKARTKLIALNHHEPLYITFSFNQISFRYHFVLSWPHSFSDSLRMFATTFNFKTYERFEIRSYRFLATLRQWVLRFDSV